jgi:hypothetical protein
MSKFRELYDRGEYLTLIQEVKRRISADRRAFTEPEIKLWCARRFRNLFLTETEQDPNALAEASRSSAPSRVERRPPRQQLAERFLKSNGVSEWQIEMPEAQIGPVRNTTLVFCSGLLNGMSPIPPFQATFPAVESKYGLRILRVNVHPARSCEANVKDLRDTIERGLGQTADGSPITEATAIPPKDVFLLCYSKGAPDVLELLVRHPELRDRVRCVVNWAGAVGGSYIGDGIYDTVKDIKVPLGRIGEPITTILKMFAPVVRLEGVIPRLDEYDIMAALRDMSPATRAAFMAEHSALLDSLSVPFFNLTGATTLPEVPYFRAGSKKELDRYDINNDMQLIQEQAKISLPTATDLAMFKAHHWDLVYDAFPENRRFGSSNLENPFPKTAAVTALFKLLAELGVVD